MASFDYFNRFLTNMRKSRHPRGPSRHQKAVGRLRKLGWRSYHKGDDRFASALEAMCAVQLSELIETGDADLLDTLRWDMEEFRPLSFEPLAYKIDGATEQVGSHNKLQRRVQRHIQIVIPDSPSEALIEDCEDFWWYTDACEFWFFSAWTLAPSGLMQALFRADGDGLAAVMVSEATRLGEELGRSWYDQASLETLTSIKQV